MRKPITVFGIYFCCLLTAAETICKKRYNTIWNRIHRVERFQSYDIELIVTVPDLRGVRLHFIGLDGQARYKVPWSDEFQTTRQIIEHYTPDLLEIYDMAHPDGEWSPLVGSGKKVVNATVAKQCHQLFCELNRKELEQSEK